MKIAIGMIVRNLISAHPLTDFLDNAEKYDHPIERVIVVYSHEADPEAIQELQRRTKVSLIRLQSYERAHMILKQLGVRFSSIYSDCLFPCCDGNSRHTGNFCICISPLQEKTLPKYCSCGWANRIRCLPVSHLCAIFSRFLGIRPCSYIKLRCYTSQCFLGKVPCTNFPLYRLK